jgi:orotate phosphoribosyltransferase
MEQYKKDFIEFMVRCKVLTFGDFTTKSGRKTPFFINTGNYDTGKQLQKLGDFYAMAIEQNFGTNFSVLFGPAYKGIPLVVAISIAFSANHERELAFCFNRKEAKDHGEGGLLVGHKLSAKDRVLIVEDVITAGTSIRETVPLLKAACPTVSLGGLIVSVDRMERGTTALSALAEIERDFGMKVASIVTLDDIVEYLSENKVDGKLMITDDLKKKIEDYRDQYGIA